MSFNQRFAEMLRDPGGAPAHRRDDDGAIAFVLEQLLDPRVFVAKIHELYSQPTYARAMTRSSSRTGGCSSGTRAPQHLGAAIVGRVWSFHDMTRRKRLEEELARAGFARLAHRSRQPGVVPRSRAARAAGAEQAIEATRRRALHGSGQLQDGERQPRPCRGRPPLDHRRAAVADMPARFGYCGPRGGRVAVLLKGDRRRGRRGREADHRVAATADRRRRGQRGRHERQRRHRAERRGRRHPAVAAQRGSRHVHREGPWTGTPVAVRARYARGRDGTFAARERAASCLGTGRARRACTNRSSIYAPAGSSRSRHWRGGVIRATVC